MRSSKELAAIEVGAVIKHAKYLACCKGTVEVDTATLLEAAPHVEATFASISALIDANTNPGWREDAYAALSNFVYWLGVASYTGNSNASGRNQIRLEQSRSKLEGRRAVQRDASAASAALSQKIDRREFVKDCATKRGINLAKRGVALHKLADAVAEAGFVCSDETLKADIRALQPKTFKP